MRHDLTARLPKNQLVLGAIFVQMNLKILFFYDFLCNGKSRVIKKADAAGYHKSGSTSWRKLDWNVIIFHHDILYIKNRLTRQLNCDFSENFSSSGALIIENLNENSMRRKTKQKII